MSETLTFDELFDRGWCLDMVFAEAYRVEYIHFGDGAYSESDFARMHTTPGSLCALLFPSDQVQPGNAIGVEACVERRAANGTLAHQLVTIAIDPTMTGQGLGPRLDEYCEKLILERRYKLRVLRSRAPAHIYTKYGERVGGSPHGEATRFALKRGFQPLNADEARNFFGADIARLLVEDVHVGNRVLRDCVFAESHSHDGRPPWYFICMSKNC